MIDYRQIKHKPIHTVIEEYVTNNIETLKQDTAKLYKPGIPYRMAVMRTLAAHGLPLMPQYRDNGMILRYSATDPTTECTELVDIGEDIAAGLLQLDSKSNKELATEEQVDTFWHTYKKCLESIELDRTGKFNTLAGMVYYEAVGKKTDPIDSEFRVTVGGRKPSLEMGFKSKKVPAPIMTLSIPEDMLDKYICVLDGDNEEEIELDISNLEDVANNGIEGIMRSEGSNGIGRFIDLAEIQHMIRKDPKISRHMAVIKYNSQLYVMYSVPDLPLYAVDIVTREVVEDEPTMKSLEGKFRLLGGTRCFSSESYR